MASLLFNSLLRDEANADIPFDTGTFKVMLVTSTYSPNKDTHTRRSDVTNEVTGTGYTAGGTASTVTVNAVDTANDRVDVTFAQVQWASSTITARGAVIYLSLGGASSADPLVGYVDFGADVISSAGTFTLSASTYRKTNP